MKKLEVKESNVKITIDSEHESTKKEQRLKRNLKRKEELLEIKKDPQKFFRYQEKLKLDSRLYRERKRIKAEGLTPREEKNIERQRLRREIRQNPDLELIRKDQSKKEYLESRSTPEKREELKKRSTLARRKLFEKIVKSPYSEQERRQKTRTNTNCFYLKNKTENPEKYSLMLSEKIQRSFKIKEDEKDKPLQRYIRLLKKRIDAQKERARIKADPIRYAEKQRKRRLDYLKNRDKKVDPLTPSFFKDVEKKKEYLTIKDLEKILKIKS